MRESPPKEIKLSDVFGESSDISKLTFYFPNDDRPPGYSLRRSPVKVTPKHRSLKAKKARRLARKNRNRSHK